MNMMYKNILVHLKFIVFLALFLPESRLLSNSKIKVGLLVYPPYVNGPSLSDGGIVVNLLKDSGVLENEDVKAYILPPQRAWHDFKENQLDIVLASRISQSQKTLESNNFFEMFNGDTFLFFHHDEKRGHCYGDSPVKGSPTVAIIRGVESERENLRLNGYRVFEVDSPTQGIKMLLNKRVDFLHMSIVPVKVILKKYFRNKDAQKIAISSCRYLYNPVGFLYKRQASAEIHQLISNLDSLLGNKKKIRRTMSKTINDKVIINNLLLKGY